LEIQRVQGWNAPQFYSKQFYQKAESDAYSPEHSSPVLCNLSTLRSGRKAGDFNGRDEGPGPKGNGWQQSKWTRADHDQLLMGMFLPDLDMSRSSRAATQRSALIGVV